MNYCQQKKRLEAKPLIPKLLPKFRLYRQVNRQRYISQWPLGSAGWHRRTCLGIQSFLFWSQDTRRARKNGLGCKWPLYLLQCPSTPDFGGFNKILHCTDILHVCFPFFCDYHYIITSSCLIQKGNDKYKLASTSEDGGKKGKKEKDMDELKKEVDLVSPCFRNLHWQILFKVTQSFLDPQTLIKKT